MHHIVGAGGSGGRSVYVTRGVSAPPPAPAAPPAGGAAAGPYSAPPAPALPADASYAPPAGADGAAPPAHAQAYRAPSGHVLVAGRLSAAAAPFPYDAPPQGPHQHPQQHHQHQHQQQQRHWFLLDSGASGLVVDRAASRRLALVAVGEVRVAGVAGRSRARLVRARELAVGPLAIRDPVLMEMDVAGLVRNLPPPPLPPSPPSSPRSPVPSPPPALPGAASGQWPVAGIVGYDLFRRAVVDIPGAASAPAPAARGPGDGSLVMGDDGSSHSGFSGSRSGGGQSGGGGHRGGGGGGAVGPPSLVASIPALTLQQKLRRGGFVPVGLRSPAAAADAPVDASLSAAASGPAAAAAALAAGTAGGGAAGSAAAADDGEFEWLPLALVAYLPHVVLEFGVPGDGLPRRALFMLDTGASGADLMLHSRAAARLGLLPPGANAGGGRGGGGGGGGGNGLEAGTSLGGAAAAAAALAASPGAAAGGFSFVRGVGGGDGGGKGRGGSGGSNSGGNNGGGGGGGGGRTLRTATAELPWVRWGALRLEGPVRVLVATQPGGLDLSRYASGIACADLLGRADVRLDYAGRRVGMRRPRGGGAGVGVGGGGAAS